MVSFDAYELRQHLNRIYASSPFIKSQRLIKLLNYVAWRSFSDNPKHIRAYEIALDVFEKGINFDPSDPYVRNIAGLVRKALVEYYKNPHPEDTIKLTLPTGNFVVQFSAINELEIADAEIRSHDNNVGRHSAKPSSIQFSSDDLIAGSRNRIHKQYDRSPDTLSGSQNNLAHTNYDPDLVEKPLLAIVPFSSAKENDLLLGEVLAAELIRSFSPTAHLDVMSRLSTTQFKTATNEKKELHENLRADYILAGSYRVHEDNIILTIELSVLENGQSKVIWSDIFTNPTDQLLSKDNYLLSEIVRQTWVSIERHEISQIYQQPLETINLYRLMISAINYMNCGPDKLFNQSLNLLNNALLLDKNNPTTNALIAHWHIFKLNRSKGWLSGKDRSHQHAAKEHCAHALAVNPSHAVSLAVYGFYKTQYELDLDTGLSYYRAAQKFDPNLPLAHSLEAAIHIYTDSGDEAVKSAERAVKLSPFDPQLHMFETCRAAAYQIAGDLEQAEIHARKACTLNSNHTSSIRGLIAILVERGNMIDAEERANKLMQLDPGFTTSSYLARSPAGKHLVGKRIADSLRAAGIPSR